MHLLYTTSLVAGFNSFALSLMSACMSIIDETVHLKLARDYVQVNKIDDIK